MIPSKILIKNKLLIKNLTARLEVSKNIKNLKCGCGFLSNNFAIEKRPFWSIETLVLINSINLKKFTSFQGL